MAPEAAENGEEVLHEIDQRDCDLIVRVRDQKLKRTFEEFARLLKCAKWLESREEANDCIHLREFQASVSRNLFGDTDGSSRMDNMVKTAKEVEEDDWHEFFRTVDDKSRKRRHLELYPTGDTSSHGKAMSMVVFQLRKAAAELDGVATKIVKQTQSLRLARTLQITQQLAKDQGLICDSCGLSAEPDSAIVLFACGHLVCKDEEPQDACPVRGCSAQTIAYQNIPAIEFQTLESKPSEYGQKIDNLLELMEEIVAREQYGLLFIQDKRVIPKVKSAAEERGIEIVYFQKNKDASKILADFKQRINTPAIMILNIGDESAAGCNLTIANHVIFFAPYLTIGSSAARVYTSAMTQAIGRARCYGQEKKVEIHYFLTAGTFDVDLFEERERVKSWFPNYGGGEFSTMAKMVRMARKRRWKRQTTR